MDTCVYKSWTRTQKPWAHSNHTHESKAWTHTETMETKTEIIYTNPNSWTHKKKNQGHRSHGATHATDGRENYILHAHRNHGHQHSKLLTHTKLRIHIQTSQYTHKSWTNKKGWDASLQNGLSYAPKPLTRTNKHGHTYICLLYTSPSPRD